ncbi:hypothetical protein [Actinophytocola sp.]|uniref:hypothetical protein n=1 Tax=Actinophytocola sp. TaxID=1872138 RepID=UPI002D419443|nr:hypothetical protein [Actinophytocola sp.]HYQ69068.1 hypothetical protein [Actinophytocola sp.]
MTTDATASYGLVMRFVTVASKGGPHDDQSYVSGWHMGALDLRLAEFKPAHHVETIRTADVVQADLVAMRHGYCFRVEPTEVDGWEFAEFTRKRAQS